MSNPFWRWSTSFALSAQAARMCWDAQAVIFLRCSRIAQGGAKAEAETTRMIAEKVAALAEAQISATSAAFRGGNSRAVTKRALGVYARRVSRNRRRLMR